MNRVLVTGGAGTLGAAVVRRLLRDPAFEVRVSDRRPAPQWMREGCEVHTGDLRSLADARTAVEGCSHVVHVAAMVGGIARFHRLPHTLTEVNHELDITIVRAALDHDVERFAFVSSSMVYDRATEFPTPEEHLDDCPPPRTPYGFSKLAGEVLCRAAHDEHGLRYTICRPFNAYGPGELPEDAPGEAHLVPDLVRKCLELPLGEPLPLFGGGTQTRTPTYVADVADGIVTAMASPAGLCEAFNVAAGQERTVADIARAVWEACGRDPDDLVVEPVAGFDEDVARRWPSVEKARRLLGWEAQVPLEEGLAHTVGWLRRRIGAAV